MIMKQPMYCVYLVCVLQVVLIDAAVSEQFTNATEASIIGFNSWDVPQSSVVHVCDIGWSFFNETSSCFQGFDSVFVQQSALDYCTTEEGFLATVTSSELDFLSQMTSPSLIEKWWMAYELQRHNSSSDWELIDVSDINDAKLYVNWMGVKPPQYVGDDVLRLCVVLTLKMDMAPKRQASWQTLPCTEKSSFLCKQEAKMVCMDRKNNKIHEGERYIPPGNDACTTCRCFEGRPGICATTMCARPRCQQYRPDPEECCRYICTEGDDDDDDDDMSVDVSDNMRWVLTMMTSFILLGMMLFMVYRMRQKRIAYLHYRAQQMRDGNAMDFEPGSGPPPPPNLDDIDGAVYREPPPPYPFLKDDRRIPVEQPPPYISTVTLTTDINRNRDSRSVFQQNSDAVALLDGSVSSEPNTPTTGVPVIQPNPPAYISSTDNSIVSSPSNSNISSPSNGQSRPEVRSSVVESPTRQTILMSSINTTV